LLVILFLSNPSFEDAVCEVVKIVINDQLEMPLSRRTSEELQIIQDGDLKLLHPL